MKLRRLPGKKKHFEVIFHELAEYHLLWE